MKVTEIYTFKPLKYQLGTISYQKPVSSLEVEDRFILITFDPLRI